jgi:transcriptional regulator with XRE-family HTH domain
MKIAQVEKIAEKSCVTQKIGASLVADLQHLPESADQRVSRLYNAEGGPLIGWLLDEAHRRQMDLQDMARAVGVTYGYINQLRTGIRKSSQISKCFAIACARFLRVPTVIILLISGSLTMSDFSVHAESEEAMLERAMRLIQDDPVIRSGVPVNLSNLCLDGKKAVAALYAEVSGKDVFQTHQLPDMLRWLQRAALDHDENSFAAAAGHRDTSERLES